MPVVRLLIVVSYEYVLGRKSPVLRGRKNGMVLVFWFDDGGFEGFSLLLLFFDFN
jgi:hypothetical protein